MIFKSSKTLEARVAQLEADLAASVLSVTSVTAERDDARAQVTVLTGERDEARTQLAAVTIERDEARTTRNDDAAAHVASAAILRTALGITDATVNCTAEVIAAAIEQIAQRKAVDIAAGQGVVPVLSEAVGTGNAADDIRLAHEAAHAEKDPRKRAAMFAKASAMVAKTHGAN